MKKLLLLAAFIISAGIAVAQSDPSATNAAKIENAPSFMIYTVPDSIAFSNKDLNKKKPFVLMFFSPDCEHCQKETKELMAYKNELKNIQILMVSPASYGEVKNFYGEYNLSTMPNVKLGQDVKYQLGSTYQLKTFPSIFVYSAEGKLLKAFVGNVGAPAIIDAVK